MSCMMDLVLITISDLSQLKHNANFLPLFFDAEIIPQEVKCPTSLFLVSMPNTPARFDRQNSK